MSSSPVSPGKPRAPLSSCPGCWSLLTACLCFLPPPKAPFTLHTLCHLHPQSSRSAYFMLRSTVLTSLVLLCSASFSPESPSWGVWFDPPGSSTTILWFLNNSFSLIHALRAARTRQIQLVNVHSGWRDVILIVKSVRYARNWENFRTSSLSHSPGQQHGPEA